MLPSSMVHVGSIYGPSMVHLWSIRGPSMPRTPPQGGDTRLEEKSIVYDFPEKICQDPSETQKIQQNLQKSAGICRKYSGIAKKSVWGFYRSKGSFRGGFFVCQFPFPSLPFDAFCFLVPRFLVSSFQLPGFQFSSSPVLRVLVSRFPVSHLHALGSQFIVFQFRGCSAPEMHRKTSNPRKDYI